MNVNICFLLLYSRGENGAVQNEDEETQDGDKKKSRLPKKKFLFTETIKYVQLITTVMLCLVSVQASSILIPCI